MDGSTAKPRLREQVRAVMRLHHYSIRTEKSYWYWIHYFIHFHQLRHPLELGTEEVNTLTWLAVERKRLSPHSSSARKSSNTSR